MAIIEDGDERCCPPTLFVLPISVNNLRNRIRVARLFINWLGWMNWSQMGEYYATIPILITDSRYLLSFTSQ